MFRGYAGSANGSTHSSQQSTFGTTSYDSNAHWQEDCSAVDSYASDILNGNNTGISFKGVEQMAFQQGTFVDQTASWPVDGTHSFRSSLYQTDISRPKTPPPMYPITPKTPSRGYTHACRSCSEAHRECVHIYNDRGQFIGCKRCIKFNHSCERVPRTPRTKRRTPGGRSKVGRDVLSNQCPPTPTRRKAQRPSGKAGMPIRRMMSDTTFGSRTG